MRLVIARHVQFVGDHDDGDALVVEFLEHAHDFDARLAVEVAGRLVGQQQRRLVDQRAGDGDALLLAAGKLVGMMVGALGRGRRVRAPPWRACVARATGMRCRW